jgi:hypothetical protein
MQKIIIFGFPHCGTTILRTIIGHIDDVEEIIQEIGEINMVTKKKYILCKCPIVFNIFFTEKYDEYIKIFIVRNPLYVFSSLNKRFVNEEFPFDHTIDAYTYTIIKFIEHKRNPIKNLYLIRYEDIFENNYKNLKNIFNSIGFEYNDKIFDNEEYVKKSDLKILNEEPDNINHQEYRNWQIKQKFVNNNDESKIQLTEEQKNEILNNEYIKMIYPELNQFGEKNFYLNI